MDEKDRSILEILKDDGRGSYTEIAEEVDVSEATVRNRVEKMRENNVIEKFTVETRSSRPKAVVMARVETGRDIEKVIEELPDTEVYEVTGEYDLILEVEEESNKKINETLDKIRAVNGVETTETYMVLNER